MLAQADDNEVHTDCEDFSLKKIVSSHRVDSPTRKMRGFSLAYLEAWFMRSLCTVENSHVLLTALKTKKFCESITSKKSDKSKDFLFQCCCE